MSKQSRAKRKPGRGRPSRPPASPSSRTGIPPATPASRSPGALLLGHLPPTRSAAVLPQAPTPAVSVDVVAGGPTGRVEVTSVNCDALDELEPQGLGVTYWFEAPADGEPHDLEVRFSGTRTPVEADEEPAEFVASRTVHGVLPGAGRVAYTARFADVAPGAWHVTAAPVLPTAAPRPSAASAIGRTAFLPVVRELAPGMSMGSWPALVALGAVAGVASLLVLASRHGMSVAGLAVVALVACIVGLAGAKAYFVLQSDSKTSLLSTGGMCIQGFVIGAFATVAAGSMLLNVPTGTLLDLAAPGVMFGVMFGRAGCWKTGCCAGRPSTHRFALWSTDREIGIKRIPVQMMEGAAAAAIGIVAFVLAWRGLPHPAGALFAAVFAAYVVLRQVLFPLRSSPHSRRGRMMALAVGCLVLAIAVGALAVGSTHL